MKTLRFFIIALCFSSLLKSQTNYCLFDFNYIGAPGDYISDSIKCEPNDLYSIEFCTENVPDKISIFTSFTDSLSFYIGDNITSQEVKQNPGYYRGFCEFDYNNLVSNELTIISQDVDTVPYSILCGSYNEGGVMRLWYRVPQGMCNLRFSVSGNNEQPTIYWCCIKQVEFGYLAIKDTVYVDTCVSLFSRIFAINCENYLYIYRNNSVIPNVKIVDASCLGKEDGSIIYDHPYENFSMVNIPAGTYTQLIYNDFCSIELTHTVKFDDICDYYIPNIISISGQNYLNRIFTIFTKISTDYQLSIFDRWGNLINKGLYQSNNTGWDGTFFGFNVSPGVYTYLIEIGTKKFGGSVTLIN